jgi:hypothetical protein
MTEVISMAMPGGAWTVYGCLVILGAVWVAVVMTGVAVERLRHPRARSVSRLDQPTEHRVAA